MKINELSVEYGIKFCFKKKYTDIKKIYNGLPCVFCFLYEIDIGYRDIRTRHHILNHIMFV